jgi:SpoIID/LytB domain protein
MSIARLDRAAPVRRPARVLWAGVLAVLLLALVVTPAFAVMPASAGSSGPAAPQPPAVANAPVADLPTPAPSASPATPPSGVAPTTLIPMPSPSPSPAASALPSPSPSASPSPTPTPVPTPSPTPAWSKTITTVGASIRFYGRGNGHGVGLSQYGARGRALAGQLAPEILAAYFSKTTLGTTSSTRPVRVLVLSGFAGASTNALTLHGRSAAWSIDGVALTFPADAALTAWRTSATVNGVTTTTWQLRVTAADGVTQLYSATRGVGTSVTLRSATTAGLLEVNSKPSTYDTYRGSLKLELYAASANVVNTVGLDDYLKGVVPNEMPASWPAEALKAQAVVARGWTVCHLSATNTHYDVYDDSRSQVYRGVLGENAVVNALIASQPGAVLLSGTAVVNGFYSSAAGGWTENNEYGFVPANGVVSPSTALAYLRGRDDRAPNGTAYDAAAPGFAWTTAVITKAQLSAILAADSRTSVGTVTKLDLTHRGVSGRVYQVVIYGTTGTKTVSGDVFRAVYNAHRPTGSASMNSNLFDAAPLR